MINVELRPPKKGDRYLNTDTIYEAKSNFGNWPGCNRYVVVENAEEDKVEDLIEHTAFLTRRVYALEQRMVADQDRRNSAYLYAIEEFLVFKLLVCDEKTESIINDRIARLEGLLRP